MDRASIYISKEGEPSTYVFDEDLPPLPLPNLSDTLVRYYESLKPFGTEEELSNSRKIIDEFSKGIGAELHKKLAERASKMKNWLDVWWDAYAYHILRIPLHPYIAMSMPLKLDCLGITESKENSLQLMARIMHHTFEYWELIRTERMKPASSGGGKIKYCSALLKRFMSTTRVPGETVDKVVSHFKIASEGDSPRHGMLVGKGRIFMFDCVNDDGSILSPQQILVIIERVNGILGYKGSGDCVPILTHDERTSWAHNRQRLLEISPKNKDNLELVESSVIVAVLDDNEPKDYAEVSAIAVNGDYHSKWADRSSIFVAYRNGKFALVGEHSAYDGTISVHFAFFIHLSLMECGEPDWSFEPKTALPVTEIEFDLDDTLRNEIQRVLTECDARQTDVHVTDVTFDGFGKDYIKTLQLHPDSFIQIVIQWVYYVMHGELAAIYETALMRQYYNGRTETLRSCTLDVVNFIQLASNPNASKQSVVEAFRKAVKGHSFMMNEAREGRGVDRHLFGLWCVAYEADIEIPAIYSDPLYTKSGGGGNFVLSTSTLGYTINNGFVAPMVTDGYGVFYSIVSNAVNFHTTVFRDSQKTSAHKFNKKVAEIMTLIKDLFDNVSTAKL